MIYTDADFEGLFEYLEEDTCNGPKLVTCEIGDMDNVPVEEYLLNIDNCLNENKCLSHHQILFYIHKTYVRSPMQSDLSLVRLSEEPPVIYEETEADPKDLELAEINYLCIIASLVE